MRYSYRIAGLAVESSFALPGAIEQAQTGAADVTIGEGAVPQALATTTHAALTWALNDSEFLLTIDGVARFLITGGREITVDMMPGAIPADASAFLVGSVFGILLHQRRSIVLHASAVRIGGKAVVFCGASGAGKSTMAAALAQKGYPVVADDFCAISIDANGRALVQPDGRQLKLWMQSIENLALEDRRSGKVRDSLEKYFITPDEAELASLPLGAVYALVEARPPEKPGITRPNIVDVALLLRRNAYRPQLIQRMGQRPDFFRASAVIANTAGIFELTRELSFEKMDDVVAMLEAHWAEIGLKEAVP